MQFWIAFQAFIFAVVVPLVRYLLKAFGIGAVTFTGLTVLTSQIKSYVLEQFAGLPSDVVMLIGLMKIDVGFNMILSAVLARAIRSGMNSSSGKVKEYTFEA